MTTVASRLVRWIAYVLVLSVCGCVSAATEVSSLSDIGAGEVLLVGKIELVPPLKPGEQQINVVSVPPLENRAFILSAPTYERIGDDVTLAQVQGYIYAGLGETFYVKRAAQPLFLNGIFFYLTFRRSGEMERVFLPAGYRVDIQPKDRAIYIGTIRYHRNEFFEIAKVEIVNELVKEAAAARKKFGPEVTLTARMPVKAAPKDDPPKRSGKKA